MLHKKGNKKVTIYSSDYKERLQEWSLDEIPTGVAIDGERIIVTVAGENKMGFISFQLLIRWIKVL